MFESTNPSRDDFHREVWRTSSEIPPTSSKDAELSRQLPDGVRTNGVVAEVPRFPIINIQRNMLAKCDKM